MKNSLFPSGPFVIRKRTDGFKPIFLGNPKHHKSIFWLAYESHVRNCKILSAANEGEQHLWLAKDCKFVRVDGFCRESYTAFEFIGKFF